AKPRSRAIGAAWVWPVVYACQLAPPSVVSIDELGGAICTQRVAVTYATVPSKVGTFDANENVAPLSLERNTSFDCCPPVASRSTTEPIALGRLGIANTVVSPGGAKSGADDCQLEPPSAVR